MNQLQSLELDVKYARQALVNSRTRDETNKNSESLRKCKQRLEDYKKNNQQ